jgi:hypothetical protein
MTAKSSLSLVVTYKLSEEEEKRERIEDAHWARENGPCDIKAGPDRIEEMGCRIRRENKLLGKN